MILLIVELLFLNEVHTQSCTHGSVRVVSYNKCSIEVANIFYMIVYCIVF